MRSIQFGADSGSTSDLSDQQFIEAFRAADKEKQEIVLNLLRLFDAWEHPREGSEVTIRRCLSNLNFPPATTYAEAILMSRALAQQISGDGKCHMEAGHEHH